MRGQPSPRIGRAGPLLFLITATLGCGSPEQRLPVFPVRGAVLVAGKPAVRAAVVFHPIGDRAAGSPRPSAQVAADGTFVLGTYTADDGAPPGEYAVTVFWPAAAAPIGGDADSDVDRLGGRYSDPATTALRARVDEQPTDLAPFRLQR